LPDADGPEIVALNGGFRTENRSLIGQGGSEGTKVVAPERTFTSCLYHQKMKYV
jgi:hypothetical protein